MGAQNGSLTTTNDKRSILQWCKDELKTIETKCDLDIPQNEIYKNLTPLGYFELFFDQDIIKFITEQTNLYAAQKSYTNIDVTEQEIRTFIGMNILAGIIKLPNYRMYWSEFTRFPPISDAMSRNRFDKIRANIHLNDNRQMKSRTDPNHDRLFKVRPFIEKLRQNFLKIEIEEHNCIGELIIPIKTHHSKFKPYKPGIKIYARYGKRGFMHDFKIYAGKSTTTQNTGLGLNGDIVLEFCEHIPHNKNFKIITGESFTSYELACVLKKKGILFTGCINSDRLLICEFEEESKSRGSFEYKVEKNENIIALKWYDKEPKHFISSYVGLKPIDNVKRWYMHERRCIEIPRPAIVAEYDKSMNGFEFHNSIMDLHRINSEAKKLYIRIFYTLLDVCVVNAWILYKTELEKNDVKAKIKPFIEFRAEVAHCLMWSGRTVSKKRTNTTFSETDMPGSSKKFASANLQENKESTSSSVSKETYFNKNIMNVDDIRFDNVGHFPAYNEKRSRCRQCKNKNSSSRIKCIKCNVGLCISDKKDCFLEYHTKQ